jgi:small subunit ribosomal protein S16
MVKIRLTRTGMRNAPSYRIVAIDSRRARDSRAIEILGFYNPSHNPPLLEFKKDRIKYWEGVGAQTSEAVKKLLAGKYEYKKYEGSKKSEENKEDKAGDSQLTADSNTKDKDK